MAGLLAAGVAAAGSLAPRLRRLRGRWLLVRWLRGLRGLRGLLRILGSVPLVLSPPT